MAPEITVFVDYQNVHITGHQRYCHAGAQIHECLLHPVRLAERIIAKRAPGGVLHQVRVYRGKPDPRKEPRLASANDQHFSEWIKDPRVEMKRRVLQYPANFGDPGCIERPREKGVDVSLAIDMVRLAFENKIDVGILVSRDTDLVPALEMVRDLKLAHIELAGWDGYSRLRVPGSFTWYHELGEEDFLAARDRRPYVV